MHSVVSLSEAALRKARFTKPGICPPLFQHACVLCGLRHSLSQCWCKYICAMSVLDTDTAKSHERYLAEIMGGHSSHLAPITEHCSCTCSNSSWKALGNYLQLSWQLKAVLLYLRKPISLGEAVGYRSTGNTLRATHLQTLHSPPWGP